MTYEKYEKAVELNARMNHLAEIECLLENACNGRLLATIGEYKFEDNWNVCITECKVYNHAPLDDDIREKLLRVIRDEHTKTLEEFKAL